MQITAIPNSIPEYVSGKLLTNDGTDLKWTEGLHWDEVNKILTAEYIGVNTSAARRKLDVLDDTNPQIRATHTDNSVYTDLQTTAAGHFIISPSGGNVGFGVADPDTKVEIMHGVSGEAQLKLSFDATDNCIFRVDTLGNVYITPSGGDAFFVGNLNTTNLDCAGSIECIGSVKIGNGATNTTLTQNADGSMLISSSGGVVKIQSLQDLWVSEIYDSVGNSGIVLGTSSLQPLGNMADLGSSASKWTNLNLSGDASVATVTASGAITWSGGGSAATNTHITSDGSDHGFIDQSVISGASPTFTGTNITAVASVTAADESADTTCFPLFAIDATGAIAVKTGDNLTFNSSTGLLTCTDLLVTDRIKFDTTNHNTILGYNAGVNLVAGAENNIFIGENAGTAINNTGADRNIAIGVNCLLTNLSGNGNIAIGYNSLYTNKGSENVGIGYNTLYRNSNGAANFAFGSYSLYANVNGDKNVALGNLALRYTTGSNNLAIGHHSGYTSTGSGNISIGAYAGSFHNLSNHLVIDNQHRTTAARELLEALIVGNFSATVADQDLTINGAFHVGNATTGQPSYFGDGGATNYVEIVDTGVTTFYGTAGLCFGSCSMYHGNWVQANAVQNTWYNVSDADFIDGQLNNVTHDGNGKLTVTKAGIYKVDVSLDFEIGTANKHFEIGFEVSGSGSAATEGIVCQEVPGGSAEYMGSTTALLDLAANATIELCVRTIDAGTPDLKVDCVSLNCVQIGG